MSSFFLSIFQFFKSCFTSCTYSSIIATLDEVIAKLEAIETLIKQIHDVSTNVEMTSSEKNTVTVTNVTSQKPVASV